jgi:hypothetical protein
MPFQIQFPQHLHIIPFNDHINIGARAVNNYRYQLTEYKVTPKRMLQVFNNQSVPSEILLKIFRDTLNQEE